MRCEAELLLNGTVVEAWSLYKVLLCERQVMTCERTTFCQRCPFSLVASPT